MTLDDLIMPAIWSASVAMILVVAFKFYRHGQIVAATTAIAAGAFGFLPYLLLPPSDELFAILEWEAFAALLAGMLALFYMKRFILMVIFSNCVLLTFIGDRLFGGRLLFDQTWEPLILMLIKLGFVMLMLLPALLSIGTSLFAFCFVERRPNAVA